LERWRNQLRALWLGLLLLPDLLCLEQGLAVSRHVRGQFERYISRLPSYSGDSGHNSIDLDPDEIHDFRLLFSAGGAGDGVGDFGL